MRAVFDGINRAGRYLTCVLVGIGFLIGASAHACQGDRVLFEEEFERFDAAWGPPEDWITVAGNKLNIDLKGGGYVTLVNEAFVFDDADYCVTIEFSGDGKMTTGSGLVFWAEDWDHYYMAVITSDGSFTVFRDIGPRYIQPVQWTDTDAIKKGAGQANEIRVKTEGDEAIVFINGQEVARFKGQPPEGPSLVGLRAELANDDADNIVGFSNLKVTN